MEKEPTISKATYILHYFFTFWSLAGSVLLMLAFACDSWNSSTHPLMFLSTILIGINCFGLFLRFVSARFLFNLLLLVFLSTAFLTKREPYYILTPFVFYFPQFVWLNFSTIKKVFPGFQIRNNNGNSNSSKPEVWIIIGRTIWPLFLIVVAMSIVGASLFFHSKKSSQYDHGVKSPEHSSFINVETVHQKCEADSDCTIIETYCGDGVAMGDRVGVNVAYRDIYQKKLSQCKSPLAKVMNLVRPKKNIRFHSECKNHVCVRKWQKPPLSRADILS